MQVQSPWHDTLIPQSCTMEALTFAIQARKTDPSDAVMPAEAVSAFKKAAHCISQSFFYSIDKGFDAILELAICPAACSGGLSMASPGSIDSIEQLTDLGQIFVTSLLQHYRGILEDNYRCGFPLRPWT